MSLCGEGGAACVGNVRWYRPGRLIITPRTYDCSGGKGCTGGEGGGSANAACAQLEQGAHPHRSRGEALVRLSIPNVLRCLEFFFPDRRYLCRAARGSLFLRGGRLPYRICRGEKATRAWSVCFHVALAAAYGNPTDASDTATVSLGIL